MIHDPQKKDLKELNGFFSARRPMTKLLTVKTVQGGVFRSLFDALKDIVHDVNLRFDSTGIKLVTMDNAKCALVHLKLDADAFEEYECEGMHDIGVNVANVFKLIRAAGSHDSISLSYDKESPHELEISIQNFSRNSTTTFALKLIELDCDEIEIQDVDFDTVVTIPSVYFQRICRDMSDISNFMRIRNEDGTITFECTGDFASQKTVIGRSDDRKDDDSKDTSGTEIATNVEGSSYDGEYSLKYLTAFCKSSNLCQSVELYLRENYPLVMRYGVASLGSLKFCLMQTST